MDEKDKQSDSITGSAQQAVSSQAMDAKEIVQGAVGGAAAGAMAGAVLGAVRGAVSGLTKQRKAAPKKRKRT